MTTYIVMGDDLTLNQLNLFFKETLKRFKLRFTTHTKEHYYFKEKNLKIIFYPYETLRVENFKKRYSKQKVVNILLLPSEKSHVSKSVSQEIVSEEMNISEYSLEVFKNSRFFDQVYALIFGEQPKTVYLFSKISYNVYSEHKFKTELSDFETYFDTEEDAIQALKKYLGNQISHSEQQIQRHQKEIIRSKKALEHLN